MQSDGDEDVSIPTALVSGWFLFLVIKALVLNDNRFLTAEQPPRLSE